MESLHLIKNNQLKSSFSLWKLNKVEKQNIEHKKIKLKIYIIKVLPSFSTHCRKCITKLIIFRIYLKTLRVENI